MDRIGASAGRSLPVVSGPGTSFSSWMETENDPSGIPDSHWQGFQISVGDYLDHLQSPSASNFTDLVPTCQVFFLEQI